MDGWISSPPDCKISVTIFTEAIKDWFRYEGRTYDISCYENYNLAYNEWNTEWTLAWFEHLLQHQETDTSCKYCWSLPKPDAPKKADYFPEEPSVVLLSVLLASLSGRLHIDKW